MSDIYRLFCIIIINSSTGIFQGLYDIYPATSSALIVNNMDDVEPSDSEPEVLGSSQQDLPIDSKRCSLSRRSTILRNGKSCNMNDVNKGEVGCWVLLNFKVEELCLNYIDSE